MSKYHGIQLVITILFPSKFVSAINVKKMEVILTKRELEILKLIAKELTTENIATYLKISKNLR